MIQHPQFNPIALQIGPLSVHWYGLMYLIGFALVWILGNHRIKQQRSPLDKKGLEDLIFYSILGVIIGGRLGYALFYQPEYYLQPKHWLEILYVWQGGMAFHGGLIGVIAVLAWFSYKRSIAFLALGDFLVPLIPLGLAAGRLGNFINGELWGRPTDVPWAMVFPQAMDRLARHPSQLYQMALEGITLFIVLWWFSSKPRPQGQVSAVFLMGYGICRFMVEFTREPDVFLGLLWAQLSMGQLLSLPMILLGAWLFNRASKSPHLYSN